MTPPANALDASQFALRGRIVTLDPQNTVLADGVLYVRDSVIEAVQPVGAPAPPGFEHIDPVDSGGTIYPGLIELHNHLPYDVLQLWPVPKKYSNRAQWGGSRNPAYHRLVTGPMTVLGEDPHLMPAVVRYVEAKALVNGTTTSQGIALFSNAGARRMYRGIVRNVEATDDPALPEAGSRIADVEAVDAARFLARLHQPHRLLLHLAEGTDAAARAHFQALEFQPGQWAITENLVGIHCTALTAEDFRIYADHGGSMVWSPLSNLLLYGGTADIAAARKAGVLIGLGSDWAISGSKGLLGELKAARLSSDGAGGVFSDRELVAMATRDAARILQWDQTLGSLRPGMRADLLTIAGTGGDPYSALIDAGDADILLVTIDGVARYGTRPLMEALVPGAPLEDAATDTAADHVLHLQQASADPIVAGVTLAEATGRLSRALHDLPALAAQAAQPQVMARPDGALQWQLALDEIRPTGAELRPRLALRGNGGQATGPEIAPRLAQQDGLVPLSLDALTASTDAAFLALLATEANLPEHYGAQLSELLT